MDEEEWEATYGLSPLKYGISLEQGLRETMEDATQVGWGREALLVGVRCCLPAACLRMGKCDRIVGWPMCAAVAASPQLL